MRLHQLLNHMQLLFHLRRHPLAAVDDKHAAVCAPAERSVLDQMIEDHSVSRLSLECHARHGVAGDAPCFAAAAALAESVGELIAVPVPA